MIITMRSNITICDERFFVDKDVYTEVIVPFQSGKRRPKFTHKAQWSDMKMVENNKTIYTSSSVMASHWGYQEYETFTRKMLNGESYMSVALPVQMNILSGFKTVEDLREVKLNYTPYKWQTEFMATFPSVSDSSFYSYDDLCNIQKCKALYPKYYYELLKGNSKMKYIPKEKDEIRLVSADIALVGGRKNDKSVYTIIRLIPTTKGYKRQICYMESHEGMLTKSQAMRINRLFYEFDCDYIVLDMNGNGQSIYDDMTDTLVDDTTGETYPPLSCINNEDMAQRCIHKDARRVIYCIKARPEDNEKYYTGLKNAVENRKMELLVNKVEGATFLSNMKAYVDLESDKQTAFLSPYEEVNDLIEEMIGLELDKNALANGKIKLVEKSGSRKDHVSSLAYGNHIANELEREYLKKINTKRSSLLDMFMMPNQNDDWIESTYSI